MTSQEAALELKSAALEYAAAVIDENEKEIALREVMLRGAARNYVEASQDEEDEP